MFVQFRTDYLIMLERFQQFVMSFRQPDDLSLHCFFSKSALTRSHGRAASGF